MKKLMALFGICLFVNSFIFAQTNVGGIIDVNTTWTLAGSPYIVTGQNIIVDAGITLTIEPGVTVKFDTTRSVQVDGTLRAVGTTAQPITFTGNTPTPQPGYWGFILMNSTSAPYNFTDGTGSILRHCVIEYAGATSAANGALRLDNAAPYINNCTIQNNSKPGVIGYNFTKSLRVDSCVVKNNRGGVSIPHAFTFICDFNTIINNIGFGIFSSSNLYSKSISNNTISNNQGNGVSLSSSKCTFTNNTVSHNVGSGLSLTTSDSTIITNNTITANQGYGIYSSNPLSCIFTNNIITGNAKQGVVFQGNSSRFFINKIIDNGGTGIEITNSTFITLDKNIISKNKGAGIYVAECNRDTITNNIISGNIATQEGGGIYMNINENSNVFKNNTLINNKAPNSSAIYYQGSGKLQADNNIIVWNNTTGTSSTRAVYLGTSNQNTHISFQNNNIYNGSCAGGTFYGLYAGISNSDSINAINTYWNQPTWSAINNVIWEYLDSSQLGRVISKPFLLLPDTNAPVTPVKNIKKTDIGGGDVLVRWDANLETDVAGYKIYWGTPTGYSFANVKNVGNVTNYILNGVSFSDTITVTAYDNDTTGTDDQVLGHESWFGYEDACNFIITKVNESISKPNISIYPNPSFGTFTLINTGSNLSNVEMYNILGGKIFQLKISQSDYSTIDISAQPEGIYFLKIRAGEVEWVRKIVITK